MKENNKRAKIIGEQFKNELLILADKTDKEIQQMLDDYVEAMKSHSGIAPEFYHRLETYENMILVFIENLLMIRTRKRVNHLKRRTKELEERRKKGD